ncbi:MAG: hypothetical protein KKI15_19650 [Proteobacteria bacterium]|nr:hypothetical protein [Pseudomonadota bacterium]
MLLSDIIKQAKEKPHLDWEVYCQWKILHCGSLWGGDESKPVVWKCSCGAVNTSVAGEKYGRCQHCGLIFLAFLK